ncbi:MAG: YtxH domain-containing protein [Paenisporosarcina sp.]
MTNYKPNYNEAQYNHDFYKNKSKQTEAYLPHAYEYQNGHRDALYSNDEVNSKDFVIGVLVGGIIGAAAALFLAPKSGRELRENVSLQAMQLKDKTADLSSTAKEKTSNLSTQLKEQSGQIVDKVKSIKSKSAPMDDGTASSEGEEPIDFLETVTNSTDDVADEGYKGLTATAKALQEAVEEQNK